MENPNQHSVLLVSDDSSLIEPVRKAVDSVRGCRVCVIGSPAESQNQLETLDPRLIVLHVAGNELQAAESFLQHPFLRQKPIAIVIVRDRHDGSAIGNLLRLGVADVLVRPLDLSRLVFLIDTLTLRARYTLPDSPAPVVPNATDPGWMHCGSPAISATINRIQRVAGTDATVLLTGETGCGKSRFAKLIHDESPRSSKQFLVVNCASLSPSLIESELFGHSKGAFSGAESERVGKLAASGEGTLFLDDIDALPLDVQGRLLRAIDERQFEPVGSNRTERVEARIIVASNRDLMKEVGDDRFRKDLYFRLNVVEFRLPPLRSRPEDILPLAEGFLQKFAAHNQRSVPVLPETLRNYILAYDWPGNIRQLRNAMERVVTLSDDVARLEDLPIELHEFAGGIGPEPADKVRHGVDPAIDNQQAAPTAAEELHSEDLLDSTVLPWVKSLSTLARARISGEIRGIVEALQRTGNNRSRAARELGISRVALYKKLHKYGLMNAAGD